MSGTAFRSTVFAVVAVFSSLTAPLHAQEGLDTLLQTTGASNGSRSQVPAAEQSREAIADVRNVFREEYSAATNTEKRQALSRQLAGHAANTANTTERYALLMEAMRLAADAGDVELTFKTSEAFSRQYAVDGDALKLDALTKLALKVSPQSCDQLARTAFAMSRSASEAGNSPLLQKALPLATSLAKKSRNRALATEISLFQQSLKADERASRELAALEGKLAAAPDSPDVCLQVGSYLCFKAGDWGRGLPLLAKGSDTDLSRLAIAELNSGKASSEATSLADAWWDWASDAKSSHKAAALRHAADIYETILDETQGLERVRLERRIREAMTDAAMKSKRVALADLDVFSANDIWGGFRNDGTIGGDRFTCGGKPWPKGLSGHITDKPGQPSSMTYRVPTGARRLVGTVGVVTPSRAIGTPAQPYGPQIFEILLDGKSAWKSPPLAKRDETADFDILLQNAQTVELQVRSVAFGRAWSAWLNPEFAY